MKNSFATYLKYFLASSLLTSATAFAHFNVEDESEIDQDRHIQLQEEAHEAEYNFRQQLEEMINNGMPFDVSSGQCKYVTTIYKQAPAKTVALTFDDGPSNKNTGRVLDILKKYNIKATFFMLGIQVKAYPELAHRVLSEGHLIGNHSYSHPTFPLISEDEQRKQVLSADKIIAPYMLAQKMKIFRYPYGAASCYTNNLIKSMKYTGILGWHVDTCDWAFAKTGVVTSAKAIKDCAISLSDVASYHAHVVRNVHAHNGGVILMHDINKRTVDNLEDIITTLLKEGYQFTNMNNPEMLKYFANQQGN